MTTPDSPAPAPQPDPAAPAADAAPRKVRILRPSAIIVLLVLAVVLVCLVPFVVEPYVVGRVKAGLAAANLHLGPETKVDLSVFGGRLRFEKLRLIEEHKGERNEVFSADEATADIALMDSIRNGDAIIDRMVVTGAQGSLKRRSDGTVPMIPPPEDGSGTDWSKVDWYGYGKKVVEYLKKKREEQKKQEEEERRKQEPGQDPQQPAPQPTSPPDQPKAVHYKPRPAPGQRGPRLLIRDLQITGTRFGMPDDTPFEVTSFSVTGKDVTGVQLAEETMTLKAKVATRGAGAFDLDLTRSPGDVGGISVEALDLPLQVLADPQVGGGELAQYRPQGTGRLTFRSGWNDWDLTGGTLVGLIRNFDFAAPADASKEVQQVASLVKKAKPAELTWPMKIGGEIYAPRITDAGLDDVGKNLAGSALKQGAQELQQRGLQELNENKQVQDAQQELQKKTGVNPADALKKLPAIPGTGR